MQNALKIFIALLIVANGAACTKSDSANSNSNSASQNNSSNNVKSNSVKDEIEELELTINLPVHPEEARWLEENQAKTGDSRVPAPTDKKLIAVLRFLKDDANKLAAQIEKNKTGTPEIINTESWFPSELIAQSQISGDETLRGTSYPANDFYNMPYTDGKITRIEGTDYFVLELFAK